MSRQAPINSCKVCVNREIDFNLGLVCSLNGNTADFEDTCKTFNEDSSLKSRVVKCGIDNHLATTGQRFTNYLVDFICMLLFIIVFSFMLGVVLALVSPESLSIFEGDNKLLEYLIGFVAGTIYYSALEGISGQSIGKVITKTKVVTETGEKPDFGTILIRTVCRYIPFEALSFLGSNGIGWHDLISKTRVVPTSFKTD